MNALKELLESPIISDEVRAFNEACIKYMQDENKNLYNYRNISFHGSSTITLEMILDYLYIHSSMDIFNPKITMGESLTVESIREKIIELSENPKQILKFYHYLHKDFPEFENSTKHFYLESLLDDEAYDFFSGKLISIVKYFLYFIDAGISIYYDVKMSSDKYKSDDFRKLNRYYNDYCGKFGNSDFNRITDIFTQDSLIDVLTSIASDFGGYSEDIFYGYRYTLEDFDEVLFNSYEKLDGYLKVLPDYGSLIQVVTFIHTKSLESVPGNFDEYPLGEVYNCKSFNELFDFDNLLKNFDNNMPLLWNLELHALK